MTVADAFGFSEKQWDELEGRYEAANETAAHPDGRLEYPERLMIELLKGLSDVEKMALALGVMVGRASGRAKE